MTRDESNQWAARRAFRCSTHARPGMHMQQCSAVRTSIRPAGPPYVQAGQNQWEGGGGGHLAHPLTQIFSRPTHPGLPLRRVGGWPSVHPPKGKYVENLRCQREAHPNGLSTARGGGGAQTPTHPAFLEHLPTREEGRASTVSHLCSAYCILPPLAFRPLVHIIFISSYPCNPPPPPIRRPNLAEFAELVCQIVRFLNFADLFCRITRFLGLCRLVLPTCWGLWVLGHLSWRHPLLWDTA